MSVSAKDLLAKFQKSFGAGIGGYGAVLQECQRVPTGFFPFDLATGGGFPRGRASIVYGMESSGKTNCALRAIANHQKIWPKLACVYFDIENSLNPAWASALGVDMSKLIVVKPDFAEQVVDMVESFLFASDIGMIVVDSLAAMITSNEAEKGAETAAVGGSSILVGKLVRKCILGLTKAEKEGRHPTVVYVNQIRIKVGCFSYETRVMLADGTTEKIGKIVCNKLPVSVLAMDPVTGRVEAKPVVQWHRQPIDAMVRVRTDGGANGSRSFTATLDHAVFTPGGWRKAGTLQPGETVWSVDRRYYTDEQHELLLGAILGDGGLRFEKGGPRGHLRFTQGLKQEAYLKWKAAALGATPQRTANYWWFGSRRSHEFGSYAGIHKAKGLIAVPDEILAKVTLRTLAIWYLGDGTYQRAAKYGYGKYHLALTRADPGQLARIAMHLATLGAGEAAVTPGRGLSWYGDEAARFGQAIAPFVPACMAYKLHDQLTAGGAIPATMTPGWDRYPANVLEVTPVAAGRQRRHQYDLGVQDHHNYVVSGVQVHNSMYGDPTTMPGGNAPKFQSALTVKFYGKNITDAKISKVMPVRKQTTFTIQKWKVPIVAVQGDYEMVAIPHDGFKTGEVDDWSLIKGYLADYQLLTKDKNGWLFDQQAYPTQQALRDQVYADPIFGLHVRNKVVAAVMDQGGKPALTDPSLGE